LTPSPSDSQHDGQTLHPSSGLEIAAPAWRHDRFIVGSGGAVDPEAVDRVHAWFHCPRRHPQGLDGGCDCGSRYAQLSGRERQWLHTGHSDWSCCDD
jgi:hypothetical protein